LINAAALRGGFFEMDWESSVDHRRPDVLMVQESGCGRWGSE
jgi:hypothetical protein